MKTEWDYSDLAESYVKRPDYAGEALEAMLQRTGLGAGASICDVGAGVGHLALPLAQRGYRVTAVEPNNAMRSVGMGRCAACKNIEWIEGTGENTGLPKSAFDFVTFGSSFNVCDRARALIETHRILKPHGWFACMWNHRDLDDPIQERIEEIIARTISSYGYGVRREDQEEVINATGLFDHVHQIEGHVIHRQAVSDCVEAWRSHATLQRQAGEKFTAIVDEIEAYLQSLSIAMIAIPYTTRIWMAQMRPELLRAHDVRPG